MSDQSFTVHDKVLIIDIDGTLTLQNPDTWWGSNNIINGSADWIREKKKEGYYIVFWTGRSWKDFNITKQMLDEAEIPFDELVCEKPITTKMVIVDDKPIDIVKVEMNRGLRNVHIP